VHERGEGGYKEAGGATEGVHASKTLVRTWTGGGGGGRTWKMPPCMAQTAPPCSSLNFPSLSSIDIGGAAVGVQEVKMVQLVLDPQVTS